jgi:hypothetical protein
MSEDVGPNLYEVIDYRFLEIEAELLALGEYSEAVERQLPFAVQSETKRLESELVGAEEYELHNMEQWIYQFTEEVLPRFFRSSILIGLWAIFDSAVLRIARYLQRERGDALSIQDLRGKNDFDKYQKYYEHVLGFPLIGVEEMREDLDLLLLVRNALAHSNGLVEMIKPENLQKIRSWERVHGIVSTEREYLSVSTEFVQRMSRAVSVVLSDLMRRVKESTQEKILVPADSVKSRFQPRGNLGLPALLEPQRKDNPPLLHKDCEGDFRTSRPASRIRGWPELLPNSRLPLLHALQL